MSGGRIGAAVGVLTLAGFVLNFFFNIWTWEDLKRGGKKDDTIIVYPPSGPKLISGRGSICNAGIAENIRRDIAFQEAANDIAEQCDQRLKANSDNWYNPSVTFSRRVSALADYLRNRNMYRLSSPVELREGKTSITVAPDRVPADCYEVSYRAAVDTVQRAAAGLSISLNMAQTVFAPGDQLEFTVSVSQDCFITVINLVPYDSMIVLYPVDADTADAVKTNETFNFPPLDADWIVEAALDPGLDSKTEALLIVALRERHPLSPLVAGGSMGKPTTCGSKEVITKWIAGFDPSDIAIDVVSYKVIGDRL